MSSEDVSGNVIQEPMAGDAAVVDDAAITKLPSPNQVKDLPNKKSEEKWESVLLSTLSQGDKVWEDKVISHSQNPDDPPILPGWNLQPCNVFFEKAVAYGVCGGPILPPVQIFAGAHPAGPVTATAVQQLQLQIIDYLVSTNPGASIIGGANGAVGLACTARQFGIACGQLGRLELHPWFLAVLSHSATLTGTLASIYMPRPRVASGLCDIIPFNCTLWT